jgi:hypothetical protein
VFQKQASGQSDSVMLYGNARGVQSLSAAPVQLNYTSFAEWTHTDSVPERTRRVYFAFGQPTGTGTMPRTGSASYATTLMASSLSGTYAPVSQQSVSGTATFSADFANGSVSTNLQLSSSSSAYAGTGTISADTFAGSFASASPTFTSGNFRGGFYGPNAKEMGYIFLITHTNADPYAGATIAPGLTFINGVVVGAQK